MADRHFVFLQGMPSPFFRRIGEALSKRNHRVTRINFCIGDWLFWSGHHTLSYRGSGADWPEFFGDFLDRNLVTDLVLLGEQRRYHKEAVVLAQTRGIRVVANDFGYLRPDWITLERDGMGGNSQFPRVPEEIFRLNASVPVVDLVQRFQDSASGMARADLLYNFANLFLGLLYPHYRRTDHRPHTLIYTLTSAVHLLRGKLRQVSSQRKVGDLVHSKTRYFVLPLQLDHDFQIVAYSPFSGMEEVIRLVMTSFSRFASSGTRLVIKVHPWDAGLVNWDRVVRKTAESLSVVERVDFMHGGNLDELARHAEGMVTVNSTSGLHALQVKCPVKVLGQAVYDVRGLTYQGSLDTFWQSKQRPDTDLLSAFVNLMAATIQLRGVFFSEPGCTAAVQSAVKWLEANEIPSIEARNFHVGT